MSRKRGKNKKAIESEVLIFIIIALFSFAAILFYFYIIKPNVIIDKATCRTSVEVRSLASLAGQTPLPLRCKTNELELKYDDYKNYLKSKGRSYNKIGDAELDNYLKMRIANEMYDCWWQFGEGALNPFGEKFIEDLNLVQNKPVCGICAIITFDNEIKSKTQSLNIFEYMKDTQVPTKDYTYLQYFSKQEDTKLLTQANIEETTLETDNEYTILFFYFKADKFRDVLVENFGTAAGGAALGGGAYFVAGKVPVLGNLVSKLGSRVVGFFSNPYVLAGTIATAILGISFQGYTAYQNQKVAVGYCGEGQLGCYQAVLTEWNAQEVGSFCGDIETIP